MRGATQEMREAAADEVSGRVALGDKRELTALHMREAIMTAGV